jgi:Fibronectin type III domain
MAKTKLNLKNLSTPEKIARARQIVTAVTNNAHFPTPNPPLTQVSAAIDAVEQLNNEVQAMRAAAKAKTSELYQQESVLDRTLAQLAAYVESVSGGDDAKINSAGLDVRAQRSPAGDLAAPGNLSASAGDHEGEIDLHWDKVGNARSYVVEQSLDPPSDSTWSNAAVVVKSQATIEDLTSGRKYWFRIAAVGATGQSGWSNPATKIAP